MRLFSPLFCHNYAEVTETGPREADRGFEILTVLVNGLLNRNSPDPNVDRRVWTAIWVPDREKLDRSANYVFWVKPPGRNAVCSEPFQPSGAVVTVPPAALGTATACPAWSKP